MRYLAIDPGSKRTGLAIGDEQTTIVTALSVVVAENPQQRLDAIARIIDTHGPEALVLGLPLNMDGSEGPPARDARQFAAQLQQRFGLPVHLADERLTSAAADDRLARTGLTHDQKKRRHDSQAAAVLLRDYLSQRED